MGIPVPGAASARSEDLALLYQGLFTVAGRIRAGRQQISNAPGFRQRMREALAEVAREAMQRGYAIEQTMESDFAVVALLDETILNSNDPSRDEWAAKPLQEDLYQISVAGELFFTRLEKLLARPDSPQLADILEVYALCLMLGFEGKYAIGGRADLTVLLDRVQQRIDRIRGPRTVLAPAGLLPEEPPPPPPPGDQLRAWRLGGLGALGAAALLFVLLLAHLTVRASSIR